MTLSSVNLSRIKELEEEKDAIYAERDQLVAVLTKLAPLGKAWLSQHPEGDQGWDDEWRTIVFIEFPTGQTSWHIHDSEVSWFSHLPMKPNTWDGHTTEEKHRRLQALEPKAG